MLPATAYRGYVLRPLDVSFPTRSVTRTDPSGAAWTEQIATGMPKLGPYSDISQVAVFLYESREDAEAGKNSGGTGFLVSVPSRRWPRKVRFVHAVTNWHVAVGLAPPASVIRLNTRSGKPAIFEFGPEQWVFRPGGPDVAVSPLLTWSDDFRAIPADFSTFFLTRDDEKKDEIGPAEDVFMVGRFVDYDGEEVNLPALRFGHISIIDAKIIQDTGYKGRSIVIDMHSRSGFSGSPVFVYRTLGSYFLPTAKPGEFLAGGGHYLKLLGVHWGQFPEEWELVGGAIEGPPEKHSLLITDGAYVKGLSGMTCVVPAWDIAAIIESPELVAMREEQEKIIERSGDAKKLGPITE